MLLAMCEHGNPILTCPICVPPNTELRAFGTSSFFLEEGWYSKEDLQELLKLSEAED